MTQLLTAISGRFACREFTAEPVSAAQLDTLIEAGRIAPSAFGIEPWRFVVVESEAAKTRVTAACGGQVPAATAPLLIAIVALVDAAAPASDFVEARLAAEAGGPPPQALREMYRAFHAGIEPKVWAIAQCHFAAAQMMLQATALGLASCPIGGFDEAALAAALGLSPGEAPALLLALGHCAQAQGERRRRARDELVRFV